MHSLTEEMQHAIDLTVQSYETDGLVHSGRKVSERYRTETAERRRLIQKQEAAAYAVSRMPATYGAAHFVLSQCMNSLEIEHFSTYLDCGSGTGAVVLAANDIFSPERVVVQEYETAMISIGRSILERCEINPGVLEGNLCDILLPKSELVTEGYVLSELSVKQRKTAVLNMWKATEFLLVLIEPGTPEGFAIIQEAKKLLTEEGAFVVAPCMTDVCPILADDWCHFSVRVSRSRLHKQIKGGTAPFEDEKFCFVALSRKEKEKVSGGRVLRHPVITEGKVTITLCTGEGKKEYTVTKKDPLWKRVRKIKWGEYLAELP